GAERPDGVRRGRPRLRAREGPRDAGDHHGGAPPRPRRARAAPGSRRVTIVLQVLNGLTIGAIYILLASGLTIVFGLQGIVNIAHGIFYMLGAYLAVTLYPKLGFALTLLAAFAVTAVLGLGLELGGVRPLVRWKRSGTQVLVLTLGVAIIATELTKLVWGPVLRGSEVPPALAG